MSVARHTMHNQTKYILEREVKVRHAVWIVVVRVISAQNCLTVCRNWQVQFVEFQRLHSPWNVRKITGVFCCHPIICSEKV
jgi:hypothetical protein